MDSGGEAWGEVRAAAPLAPMLHFILASTMTLGMEIHDSRLLDLICNPDGTGHILFDAYIYRSEGVVFKDAQESGWQDFRLIFEGMRIEGGLVAPGEYASEGELWINGRNENGVILIPSDHAGDICLELVLSPLFGTLKIFGSRIRSQLEGPWSLEAIWDVDGNVTQPGLLTKPPDRK